MKFDDRTLTLKDGRQCTLKPTTSEYAQDMIDFLKITASKTPFLLRYPDEVRDICHGITRDIRIKRCTLGQNGADYGKCCAI